MLKVGNTSVFANLPSVSKTFLQMVESWITALPHLVALWKTFALTFRMQMLSIIKYSVSMTMYSFVLCITLLTMQVFVTEF